MAILGVTDLSASFPVHPGLVDDDALLDAVRRAAARDNPPRTEHIVQALGPCPLPGRGWNEPSAAQRLSTLADHGRLSRHVVRAPAGRFQVMHWALPT